MVQQQSISSADAVLEFTPLLSGYWQLFIKPIVRFDDGPGGHVWSGSGQAQIDLQVKAGAAAPPFDELLRELPG